MKKCSRCEIEKINLDFSKSQYEKSGGICRTCNTALMKIYRNANLKIINNYNKVVYQKYKQKIKERKRIYYLCNKANILRKVKEKCLNHKHEKKIYNKKYYLLNKFKILNQVKLYNTKNKERINILANFNLKRKRSLNVGFRLRCAISANINFYLKNNNSSKNNVSCLKYLDYSIEQLKLHLQNNFEPWMNWSNYGKFNSNTWNDDDISTWNWQIDHIVPQSTLPYTSMVDVNFKKCWDLNNLRPLSAKQNFMDGVRRVRHKLC